LKSYNSLFFRREISVSWWSKFLWLSVGIWHANTRACAHTCTDQHV